MMRTTISLQDEAQELFDSFKKNDRKAFNSFFIRFYSIFCSYANNYLENDESEEIVQNFMVWLWESRNNIVIESSVLQYCFKSIKNSCIKNNSRNRLRAHILDVLYEKQNCIYDEPDFYVEKELVERIRKAIRTLPESYREAFIMNRFKNMTYSQIAKELDISSKTVDYRIQCALKRLRIELKDYAPLLVGLIF